MKNKNKAPNNEKLFFSRTLQYLDNYLPRQLGRSPKQFVLIVIRFRASGNIFMIEGHFHSQVHLQTVQGICFWNTRYLKESGNRLRHAT